MAALPSQFELKFFDGPSIASAYKLWTFESGTTTLKTAYKNRAGSEAHDNPIILNDAGEVPEGLFLGDGYYTLRLNRPDAAGAGMVRTWDGVSNGGAEAGSDAQIPEVVISTNGVTLVTFPTLEYTRGNGSLYLNLNGIDVDVGVDYSETSSNSVTFARPLVAGDRVKARVGALVNPASALGTVSDTALAAAGGAGLVGDQYLPDGSSSPYLQTVSQIIRGDEVSFLRFVDATIHAAIRARSNTTDLKAQFEDAFASGVKGLYLPYGRYCTTPATCTDVNWLSLRGESRFATQIALQSVGVALTFNNLQQGHISGIEFVPIGTLASSSGLLLADGTGTTTVARCGFTAFKSSGLRLVGTVGTQLSGNLVTENLFLANEGSQLYSEYSNDWWIEKNQFGWTGGTHPAVGCELVNSSQGTYAHNYHWENVVDLKATTCGGNRYVNNRIEESTHEGVIFTNCFHQTFALNRMYANSKGNSNLYDAVVLVGENESTFQGNDVYDWTGGTHPHRYSYNIGSGCTNLTWRNNKGTGYGTAAYASTGAAALTLNADPSPSWSGGALAAGTFNFIGPAGTFATPAEAEAQAGRRCVVVGFNAKCSDVPGANVSLQLYKNGVAVSGATAVIGAAAVTANWVGTPELFDQADAWSIYLSPAGGATTRSYNVRLIVVER